MHIRPFAHAILPLMALSLTHCVFDDAHGSAPEGRSEFVTAAASQSWIPFNVTQFSMVKTDFNGDGMKDLFFIGTNGDVHVRLSTGSSLPSASQLLNAGAYGSLSGGNYLPGDMNGDGKSDLFFIGNGGDVHVRTSNGAYLNEASKLLNAGAYGSWAGGKYLTGDLNGDGKSDLFFIGDGGDVHVRTSNGAYLNEASKLLNAGAYGSWAGGKYYLGDFNGDGKADLFFIGNGGNVHVRTSNGAYLNEATQLLNAGAFGSLSGGQYAMADFNGDGRADLFFIGNDGDVHVRTSNGAYLNEASKLLNAGAYGTIYGGQYYVGDFNADGKSDLFFIGNGGDVHVRTSNGANLNEASRLLNAGAYGTLMTGMYH